jgi:hypothetical protein
VQLRDGLLLTIAYFRQRLQRLGALPNHSGPLAVR